MLNRTFRSSFFMAIKVEPYWNVNEDFNTFRK